MRTTQLQDHLDTEGLRQRMLETKDREQFQRWQALYLTSKGLRAEQVADYVGVSRGTVHQWVYHYNHEGPEGLELEGRGGRRFGLLTLEQEQAVLGTLRAEAEQGRVVGAFSLRSQVEKQVGKQVSKDYLYDLLHRHGWRKVIPRPRHPKADPSQQEAFKKNFPSGWQPPPLASRRKIEGR
jgi:transposase